MAGKKKSGKQERWLPTILLLTAILNLVMSLIDLISNLLE